MAVIHHAGDGDDEAADNDDDEWEKSDMSMRLMRMMSMT